MCVPSQGRRHLATLVGASPTGGADGAV